MSMESEAPASRVGPDWDALLRRCIHCGLCLNACPTHRLTGDEVESPRGRLLLMRPLLEEPAMQWLPGERSSLDRCLGCLACQTACPSGVQYGQLLSEARERLGPPPGAPSRVRAWMVDQVLTRPRLLAVVARMGQLLRQTRWAARFPSSLRSLLDSLPQRRAQWPGLSNRESRPAAREREVAILRGCAQWVFEPEVLEATRRLIRAAGFVPHVPTEQGCCGALSHHQGSAGRARELAEQTLGVFEDATRVVVPSAGCSAFLHELEALWPETSSLRARAARLSERSEDLLTWLLREGDSIEFRASSLRVVYQNPCHHQHAQSMGDVGRRLLERIPGLEVLEVGGEELCCGSAGSYQLHQPELAKRQREEKLAHLLSVDADLMVTANPGCEFFLEAGIAGHGPPIVHLAVLLARQLEA